MSPHARLASMRDRGWALLLAGALLLTGCTSPATVSPAPTATATVPADPALTTHFPDDFTPTTAETETVRVADAIVALLPATIVTHVDSVAQLNPATADGGANYGVLRIISLSPTVDPVAIAKTMVQKMEASGWSERQSTDDASGVHLVTLTSNAKPNISWFLQLSGDPRVEGQSVIQVQLVSPDLP
jgi:hypothetical protein